MPRTIILAALLLSAGSAIAQDRTGLIVGTANASRGQKATGVIAVPAGVDAALNIPVVVMNGAMPGRTLALVAGAHGTEYASIIALEKLIERLNPQQMVGKVIIVPVVNINSFEQKVAHINPVDGKNMNRTYPGKMDGTQSERAAYLITKEVVEKCDHLIDFHGGDIDESLRPYSYWTRTGRADQDKDSLALARAFGLDHIIISTDRSKDPKDSRYLENTATTRNKPSITVEAGHAGTVEPEDVEALIEGTLSVMRHLRMIQGRPAPVEHPVWISKVTSLTSDFSGIFYPLVKRGMYVSQGLKIGYVTNFYGEVLTDVLSPGSGIVLFVRAVPSLVKGDALANIGEVGVNP
jgi:predicted deacylase